MGLDPPGDQRADAPALALGEPLVMGVGGLGGLGGLGGELACGLDRTLHEARRLGLEADRDQGGVAGLQRKRCDQRHCANNPEAGGVSAFHGRTHALHSTALPLPICAVSVPSNTPVI